MSSDMKAAMDAILHRLASSDVRVPGVGIGGFWATQILPFADPVSFAGYMDFETAAYKSAVSKKAA